MSVILVGAGNIKAFWLAGHSQGGATSTRLVCTDFFRSKVDGLLSFYPNCRDGRAVADVVRIDKGHTEGLEPNVTETVISLMVSARGGKVASSAKD